MGTALEDVKDAGNDGDNAPPQPVVWSPRHTDEESKRIRDTNETDIEREIESRLKEAQFLPRVTVKANHFFQSYSEGNVDALLVFMHDKGKESYTRTDFREYDDVRAGYGGRGYASDSRFFNALEQAMERNLVERKGPALAAEYSLTEAGKQLAANIRAAVPLEASAVNNGCARTL